MNLVGIAPDLVPATKLEVQWVLGVVVVARVDDLVERTQALLIVELTYAVAQLYHEARLFQCPFVVRHLEFPVHSILAGDAVAEVSVVLIEALPRLLLLLRVVWIGRFHSEVD